MSTHSAYQYTRAGRLSTTLEPATRTTPSPGSHQALLRVKAAALNPVDEQLAQSSPRLLKFTGGASDPPSDQCPWIPGCDFAGVVELAGAQSEWKVGDEVFGIRAFGSTEGNGTLQQYLLIDSSWPVSRKPASITFAEAAALPLVYSTVYDALVTHGRLPFDAKQGEARDRSVLILGGSSGTGSVAIQLAKKMGLKVVTTCSTRNVDFVTGLGADEVIDYTKQSVPDAALASPLAPFAVVLDCVGGTEVVQHIDRLILHDPQAPELGMYVTIVGDKTGRDEMGGAITNYLYPAQALRAFRGSLRDFLPAWTPFRSWVVGTRYRCINLAPTRDILDTIPQFLASADKVIIDSTWNFSVSAAGENALPIWLTSEQTRDAFAKLESGRAVGKVVVLVD